MTKNISIVLILITFNVFSQENFGKNEEYRKNIYIEVEREMNICKMNEYHLIYEFDEQNEIWEECFATYENEKEPYVIIYKFESLKLPIIYQEIYYTENKKLIFAQETELYISENLKDTIQWNCKYFFENEKLVDLISLGHGKTEEDNWNPDLILEKFKRRLSEFNSD
jgi:hypothetical protein